MPAALAPAVRSAAQRQHTHHGQRIRCGHHPANLHRVFDASFAQHARHPEHQGHARQKCEIDHGQQPDQGRTHGLTDVVRHGLLLIGSHMGLQHLLFRIAEPAGLGNGVIQIPKRNDAHDDGGSAFQQKQPLPPSQQSAIGKVAQNPARHDAAQNAAHRNCGHEQRNHAATALRGVPLGEVEHHTRKEPGLGRAQQKAHDVELRGGLDQQRRYRQQAPGDQNASNPAPGTKARQHHVAGHFQQKVADKEDACPQAKDGFAEAKVRLHAQLGKAHIGTVNEGKHIANEQKGNQAARDPGIQPVFGLRALG